MTITIRGKSFTIGDELTIAYGNGTQLVRIAEITKTGRVRLDRCYAGKHWESSKTLYNPAIDLRFGPLET